MSYQLVFYGIIIFLNSFKHSILLNSWSLFSIGIIQSSAAKADVGVDLNDLRIRDREPQAVLS